VDTISIESLVSALGLPAEGYTQAIFNKYMEFVGKLCYSSRTLSFVYEKISDVNTEDLIQALGEDLLETLLISFIVDEGKEVIMEEAINRLADYMGWDQYLRIEYENLMEQEQTRCDGKIIFEKTFLLHVINKAINTLTGV
jgi:dsRNA-specific ribonuclease